MLYEKIKFLCRKAYPYKKEKKGEDIEMFFAQLTGGGMVLTVDGLHDYGFTYGKTYDLIINEHIDTPQPKLTDYTVSIVKEIPPPAKNDLISVPSPADDIDGIEVGEIPEEADEPESKPTKRRK